MPRWVAFALLAAGCCHFVIGCTSLPTRTEQFAQLVNERVHVGDSEAEATARMRELGLDVSKLLAQAHESDKAGCLFCTKASPMFPLMEREWRVLLYLANDRVATIESYVFVTGP